jgi:phosphopantothenoylcysteine decarboxylase/phosphopantothenate--cysteine ligase
MDHIHLARWADVVVAAPATSNLINKLAAGIADDAVSSLWQAAYGQDKPMFLVPAMNTHMWNYPATRASVEKLQEWGIRVLPTAEGDLACGEFGSGRMLEPEQIEHYVNQALFAKPIRPRHILITGGGTREPIDSVRYIGNNSTGRTAASLAEELLQRGHSVHWLGAGSALRPQAGVHISTYNSFGDLERELKTLLGEQEFDAVIHAAAVSDYSVDRVERDDGLPVNAGGKLSSGQGMSVHLKPNPKLLAQLRGWSRKPNPWIVGFKLTHGAGGEQRSDAVGRLFESGGVDAVVHNDLDEMNDGRHPFRLHTTAQDSISCPDTHTLSREIGRMLENLP